MLVHCRYNGRYIDYLLEHSGHEKTTAKFCKKNLNHWGRIGTVGPDKNRQMSMKVAQK